MAYSNAPSSLLRNKQKTRRIAAALGVSAVLPSGVNQWPIRLRILIKIRRKKKGILVKIARLTYTTLEHRKSHVEVIRARLRKLHLISDLITMFWGRLGPERPLLGCRCILSQYGITQKTRNRAAVINARKPKPRRIVRLGVIVLALHNEVRPCLVASPHHIPWILHRHRCRLSGRGADDGEKKAAH